MLFLLPDPSNILKDPVGITKQQLDKDDIKNLKEYQSKRQVIIDNFSNNISKILNPETFNSVSWESEILSLNTNIDQLYKTKNESIKSFHNLIVYSLPFALIPSFTVLAFENISISEFLDRSVAPTELTALYSKKFCGKLLIHNLTLKLLWANKDYGQEKITKFCLEISPLGSWDTEIRQTETYQAYKRLWVETYLDYLYWRADRVTNEDFYHTLDSYVTCVRTLWLQYCHLTLEEVKK